MAVPRAMASIMRVAFTLAIALLRITTAIACVIARGCSALVGERWFEDDVVGDEHAKDDEDDEDEDEDGRDARQIPERIAASTSDRRRQLEKLRAYEAWREEFGIDRILETPKPYFDAVKRLYPHALHGVGRARGGGAHVQIEKAGQFGTLLETLREDFGVDDPARVVVEHLSYVMTFVFEELDTRPWPFGKTIRIVDVSQLGMNDLSFDVFEFLRYMSDTSKRAFVERVHKIYVLHPPAVFRVLFNAFKPLFSEKTLKQIVVCGTLGEFTESVKSEVDLRDIPREYGGECACENCWTDDERERRLRAHALSLTARSGRST